MDFFTIVDLFSGSYFAVPDYQRDFSWKNIESSTLIEDVFSVMDDSDETTHFLGAIVTVPFDEASAHNISIDLSDYKIKPKNVKHIVDGQQRLTSFSVLLRVVDDMVDSDEDISDEDKKAINKVLSSIYLGTNYKKDYAYAPRLILNGNTGKCYNHDILKISSVKGKNNLTGARRLLDAYNKYKREIINHQKSWLLDYPSKHKIDYFNKLIETLTEKITFVEIDCDAATNAFQVFDSLNGKGMDLTVADRIKNLLMSWSPPGKGNDNWNELVRVVGEENLTRFFIAYHFYNNKKRVSKNKLPDEFKKLYAESANKDFPFFFTNLLDAGELFGKLKSVNTKNAAVNSILKNFNTLQFDQPFNILFAVAWNFKNSIEDSADFAVFAKALLSLLVRMQVCEISMNKLDQTFAECIKMMRDQSASIEVIISKINDKKDVLVPDVVFESAFTRFCPTDSATEYYYLEAIENYRRVQASDNRDKLSKSDGVNTVTVEHIIPQEQDSWEKWYGKSDFPYKEEKSFFFDTVVENIGNKMLLYGDDNSSASNEDLSSKRNVYRNGKKNQTGGTPEETFQMVKEFLANEDFKDQFLHTEVEKRAKLLAKDAISIWS